MQVTLDSEISSESGFDQTFTDGSQSDSEWDTGPETLTLDFKRDRNQKSLTSTPDKVFQNSMEQQIQEIAQ